MQRKLAGRLLQTKLSINQPGDAFEQEADRVADHVMRMPDVRATGSISISNLAEGGNLPLQRVCSCGGTCDDCQKKAEVLQRVSTSSVAGEPAAPPIVHEVVQSSGEALDNATRSFMEPRFGRDFSQVRIHTDTKASESAEAVNALAYTVGTDAVFGAGQYTPHSHSGERLLAHELTHVIQQSGQTGVSIQRACLDGVPQTPSCEPDPGIAPPATRFLFKVNCDDFEVPGSAPFVSEEARMEAFIRALPPSTTVKVVGLASFDGPQDLNQRLACSRAQKGLAVIKRSAPTGVSVSSVDASVGGPATAHDANMRAVGVTVSAPTPKPCPQCPEEPRTEGCPPCPPQPEPPVFFCNKEITGSTIHRQGHAFFRIGGAAPGNPTFELEHDDRRDHCPCGFQGIPQHDYKEDVDATDAKCAPAPGISASCLAKNWNTYPIGKYCALGPNSNTYARFLAEKCGGKGLRPPGHVKGFDDSPPTPGTANNTVSVFTLLCDEINCDDTSCLPPPPPSPREKQVECVKLRGLCGNIPGGVPSDEDIHGWNADCRRSTGYSGDDITKKECPDVNLQRKENGNETPSPFAGTSLVHDVLRSPGQPLDAATRSFMEPRFGIDFEGVRIHTDAKAGESARAVDALAYTVGKDVVFATQQYQPATGAGRRLLAHELTHVAQQQGGSQPQLQRTCDPTPLKRPDFLKKTGLPAKDAPFGLTTLNIADVQFPAVVVIPSTAKGSKSKWTLDQTTAALPDPIPSFYTTGIFEEETSKVLVIPDGICAGKYNKLTYWVVGNAPSLVKQGELEHCADFQYAFDITLVKWAAAVNDLAGKDLCGDSQDKCEGYFKHKLEKKTGVAPDQWPDVFTCLVEKSHTVRDVRKALHDPTARTEPNNDPADCKVRSIMTGLPGLGTPPQDIIKCPEMKFTPPAPKTLPAGKAPASTKPANKPDAGEK